MRRLRPGTLGLLGLVVVGTAAGTAGCHDLSSYQGSWAGGLAADPTLTQGFVATQAATLEVRSVGLFGFKGSLTLPPLFASTPVESIAHASGDALGQVKVGRDALASYLAFANVLGGPPALVVVSLLPDDRIELRVVRGTSELYGLFVLGRQ